MPEKTLPTPGRWRGRVTDHDMGRSSKGNIQVAIGFAYEDSEGVQNRAVYYGVFTDKTLASEYGPLYALKNLGFDLAAENFSDKAFAALGAKSAENSLGGALIGREADITVSHEEYEGEMRAKVDWVNTPGGGLMKDRLEGAQDIRSAAAQIRSMLQGGGGPQPSLGFGGSRPAAAAPQTRKPAPAGSHDLPF